MAGADGSAAEVEQVTPLLALRFRARVVPAGAVQAGARIFRPVFWPPVVLGVLAGFVVLDWWLFFVHGMAQGVRDALYDPLLFLLVLGLVVVSAAFHEFGHAAACSYGGAKPGVMGAGIYLAWPAFFTDVTDAYRLNRAGRLRTDLGGIYFNMVFSLATAGVYFLTGYEPLLVLVVVQQFEMVHQLLPFIRLDGYYIVADLTGVPDLFRRTGPIFRSLLPWRRADKQVTELKRWVRVTVTVWVLVVIPLLLFQLLLIALHLPRIVATAVDSMGDQWHAASVAWTAGQPASAAVAALQAAVLVLPLIGIGVVLYTLAKRLAVGAWRWSEGSPPRRTIVVALGAALVALLAYVWWPNGDYEPIRPGERGTVQELARSTADVARGRPASTLDRGGDTPGGAEDSTPAGDSPQDATTDSTAPAAADPTTTTVAPTTTLAPEPTTTVP